MNDVTLILAAHGCGDGSPANQRVVQTAESINASGTFQAVIAAFNKGRPGFDDILSFVMTQRVVVVPLMTSAGYFSDDVLPRRLYDGTDGRGMEVCITPPVGMMPEIVDLVVDMTRDGLARFELAPTATEVIVVGHGTTRNRKSSQRTYDVSRAIEAAIPVRSVTAAFLDEPPYVAEVSRQRSAENLVVVPFLFGGGAHVLEDIPGALGLPAVTAAYDSPIVQSSDSGMTILLPPIGWHPALEKSIVSLAMNHEKVGRS